MGTIKNLRQKFEKLDTNTEIVKIFQRTSNQIIQLNQNQLYKSSEDSLGVKLPAYKSKVYAAEKVFKNPGLPFGQPDLKLTGGFYSGFKVDVGYTGVFTIDSTDTKALKLEAKYGIKIYGLNKANKIKYGKETVYPELIKYVKRITGL